MFENNNINKVIVCATVLQIAVYVLLCQAAIMEVKDSLVLWKETGEKRSTS